MSAVVNGNKFVTASTRERVLQAVALLEYRRDAIARRLKINRTNTVGFILSNIESPFLGPPSLVPPSTRRARAAIDCSSLIRMRTLRWRTWL